MTKTIIGRIPTSVSGTFENVSSCSRTTNLAGEAKFDAEFVCVSVRIYSHRIFDSVRLDTLTTTTDQHCHYATATAHPV